MQLDDDTGLGISRDKYIWNRGVYGDHTFVREMHYISTHGDLSQGELTVGIGNLHYHRPLMHTYCIITTILQRQEFALPTRPRVIHFLKSCWESTTCQSMVGLLFMLNYLVRRATWASYLVIHPLAGYLSTRLSEKD